MVVRTLEKIRNSLFGQKVTDMQVRNPWCWRTRSASSIYVHVRCLAIYCIKDRFLQPRYTVYCQLENLLLKTAYKDEEFKSEFDFFCSFYKDDFQPELLHSQLCIFNTEFQLFNKSSRAPTIIDLIEYFLPSQMLKKACSLK